MLTEKILLNKASFISGLTLLELADLIKVNLPNDLKRHKGFVGQIIEMYLGAIQKNRSIADFPDINLELKTIPVSRDNKVLETTFLTYCPLFEKNSWEKTSLYKKIKNILWIPIIGNRDEKLSCKNIGGAFIEMVSPDDEAVIKQDWYMYKSMINRGLALEISSKDGNFIQIRPKAKNSKALVNYLDSSGKLIKVLPLGFYLKTNYTQKLVDKHLLF